LTILLLAVKISSTTYGSKVSLLQWHNYLPLTQLLVLLRMIIKLKWHYQSIHRILNRYIT